MIEGLELPKKTQKTQMNILSSSRLLQHSPELTCNSATLGVKSLEIPLWRNYDFWAYNQGALFPGLRGG